MKPLTRSALALLLILRAASDVTIAQIPNKPAPAAEKRSNWERRFEQIAELDRAVTQKPDSAVAYFERAKAKLAAMDHSHMPVIDAPRPLFDNDTLEKGAMADFKRALELNPNYAEVYKARGDARKGISFLPRPYDAKAVIADYDSAIRLKPDFVEAYYARALQRGMGSDEIGSNADIDQALRHNPDFIPALEMRAYSRRSARDFAGAIADLDHAIGIAPNDSPEILAKLKEKLPNSPPPGREKLAQLLSLRASIKRQSDDLAGGMADLDRAIQLYPTNGYFYSTRAWMKQEHGDLIGAVGDYALYKELLGEHAGTRAAVVFIDAAGKRTPVGGRMPDLNHIYLYFALGRLQKGSIVMELKAIAAEWSDGWPKTVGLYLTGGAEEPELLDKAKHGDVATVARQQCQAFYFVGMRRLITSEPAEAKAFFEQAVATQQKDLNEFRFARAELKRLENQASAQGVRVN